MLQECTEIYVLYDITEDMGLQLDAELQNLSLPTKGN